MFEVRQAVAANAPSTRKPRFRAAHLLLLFRRDERSSHCPPPRGGGSGFSPISKFALTSNARRYCRSFILEIEHVPLAVDDLPISRDWRVDAGAALGIDQFDGLRDCVGICRMRVLRAFVRRNPPGPSERSISSDVGPCSGGPQCAAGRAEVIVDKCLDRGW